MQIYEQYWSYMAAFTDLFGNKAVSTLRVCVEFLDLHKKAPFTNELYKQLQKEIQDVLCFFSPVSCRKCINHFVKHGFLKPLFEGYPPETKEFLAATSNAKRKSLLSRIVYKYADFDNLMTSPTSGRKRHINFLLKTLEEIGHFSNEELTAMMMVDPERYPDGFLSPFELGQYYRNADVNEFFTRKYTQTTRLKNLLGKLDDIVINDEIIFYETDAKIIFGDNLENNRIIKEPYLQRVFYCELVDESKTVLCKDQAESMIVGDPSEVLVPAHIIPILKASDSEVFDVNNGLLVSEKTRQLFEKGYMTIESDGSILPSVFLSEDMQQMLSHARLNPLLMNEQRMDYLDYHRHQVYADR